MKNKVVDFMSGKVIPNRGVKYSELLEQFMTPFVKELDRFEDLEDVFEFAISAWNIANLNRVFSAEATEESILNNNYGKQDNILLKKMIAYKELKFKEFTNFIVGHELKDLEDGKDPVLSVITQEEADYLESVIGEMGSNPLESSDNYTENYINRTAIILKPKQPFVDWVAKIEGELLIKKLFAIF